MTKSARYLSITLTPEQEEAAKPHIGLKAVVATAGGGKTTTSAMSIAAKLFGDLGAAVEADQEIMATTFTKAAAGELRRKISELAGRNTRVMVGTLHSFCFDLVQKHGHLIGFAGSITNIKETERRSRMLSLLQTSLVSRGLPADKYPYSDLVLALSLVGIRTVSSAPEDLGRLAGWKCPPVLVETAEKYVAYQKVGGFVDFDTMLVFAFEILKTLTNRDDALTKQVHIPRHVYVDEAQDLSAVQWCIVEELGRLAVSLTVIGDDDQAIYGWRGATPWRFKQFYNKADVKCLLTSNRRCPSNIVAVGEGIVSHINPASRIPKTLKSSKPEQNGKVLAIISHDRDNAVAKVMSTIKTAVESGRVNYKDFLIVYRNTTHVVDEYCQAMTIAEIPYKTLGGVDPMDSDEMQLLRYSLLVAGSGNWHKPGESIASWLGLIEAVGVSSQAAESIVTSAVTSGGGAAQFVTAISASRISANNKQSLSSITDSIKSCRLNKKTVSVGDLTSNPAIRLNLSNVIEKAADKHIKNLLNTKSATQSECPGIREKFITDRNESTNHFLDYNQNLSATEMARKLGGVADDEKKNEMEATNVVTMSTAHSCKGLEFSIVFVIEPLNGIWPSKRGSRGLKTKSESILEDVRDEEIRLLYVAVTRSKQNLIFVCALPSRGGKSETRMASELLGDVVQESLNGFITDTGIGSSTQTYLFKDSDLFHETSVIETVSNNA